jgi:site-specific recombinase XerD
MRRKRPLRHPLAAVFQRSAESLTTSLGEGSVRGYLATFRSFLRYLGTHHPTVCCLEHIQRDPHILGWLAHLKSRIPSLAKNTLAIRVIRLRRLLEDLAWTQQLPALGHLLTRDDIPRKDHALPRALTPQQDQLIQQELLRRNDLASNVLLLQRHTGMRIGECADLSLDCVRPIGSDQWGILVPLGKLQTERLVPVDGFVCQLVDRIRTLRPQDSDTFLIGRRRARETWIRGLRATLRETAAAVGITTRIVPHQFRHTYATEMLLAGVTFAGLMQLLGHNSPEMTLVYLKLTQPDLQREYQWALAHPRHLMPNPCRPLSMSPLCANLPTLLASLRAAQHVLEMFRRAVTDDSTRHLLDRIGNRLIKLVAELSQINPAK